MIVQTATKQVRSECNISVAPTDTGYKYLYDMAISRRTKQIIKRLKQRQAQRGANRRQRFNGVSLTNSHMWVNMVKCLICLARKHLVFLASNWYLCT